MPAFDTETRNELKEIIKEALAEAGAVVGTGGGSGPDPWPYGDALFGTPDDLGRVKLRVVEVDLLKLYPDRKIHYVEQTVGGPMARVAPIPEWFFIPNLKDTEFATETWQVNVGSAAFYQNRAFPLITKEVRNGFFGTKKVKVPDIDSPMTDTFASQFTAEELTLMLPHLANRIVGGSAFSMWNMRSDELTVG